MNRLRITFLGLSITSSWGNGHATNYRGLVRALSAAGHDVLSCVKCTAQVGNHDIYRSPDDFTALYLDCAATTPTASPRFTRWPRPRSRP